MGIAIVAFCDNWPFHKGFSWFAFFDVLPIIVYKTIWTSVTSKCDEKPTYRTLMFGKSLLTLPVSSLSPQGIAVT